MKKFWLTAGLVVALAGLTPAVARAQISLTPFAGLTFGGDAPTEKFTTGFSVSFMGDVAGLEIDLGYTPDFFNEDPDNVILVGDSNLTTFMLNLIVGVGDNDVPVRPYVVAGLGLVRSRIDLGDLFDDVSTNEFGLTLGGGVTGMISDNVGLRGDVRYIRSLEDPEEDDDFDVAVGNFDFWRASLGVVFSFP